jgi:molecular chaperone DnaJ
LQYHPDRNKAPEAEQKFKEISEAYAVLSNDEKRRQYDQFGHAGIGARYSAEDIFRGVNFNEIFRDFGFGGFDIFDAFFGRRRSRRGPRRGSDLRYDLEITLEEAASGMQTELDVPRRETCELCAGTGAASGSQPERCARCGGTGQVQQRRSAGFAQFVQITTCNACGGKGTIVKTPCARCQGGGTVHRQRRITVDIPPGVDTGSRLRLRGEGEAGSTGGPTGDLYVVIRVKPHAVFTRNGSDVLCEVPIGFSQAALGADVAVPTLGGEATLNIPAGTQSHTLFRLRGKGLPHLRGFGRGDELVRVLVHTPKKLSSRQKDLLRDLAEALGEDVDSGRRFWSR